jgi:uncharacterized protein
MKFLSLVFLFGLHVVMHALPSRTLVIGDVSLEVEIANTEASRLQGLMFRRELEKGRGMLFIHPYAQILSHWMKNTYIPLSIAFFDEDNTLLNIEDMSPCREDRHLKNFKSRAPAKYALEVPQGWFRQHNIKPGMKFSFRDPSKSVQ